MERSEEMNSGRQIALMWKARFCLALCLFFVVLAARAFSPPAFQGDVLDETGLLSAEQQAALKQRIAELRTSDGIWAAVFLTGSLQGDSIESAAVKTFEQWRLGREDKDNGLLVMVAPKERKMRIEVGYGLEGTLTDVLSKRIVDDVYKPAFRENRYAEGLLAGFDAMRQAMQADPEALAALASEGDTGQSVEIDGGLFLERLLLVWLGNLCIPLVYWLVRRRRAKYKSEYAAKVRTAFTLFAFFGFLFGLFLGILSQAFPDDPEVVWTLLGANALFGLVFSLPLLFGGKGRGTAGSSGAEHSRASSSSSSSSWDSGSSDSSSSGGGSSGGGGASGDY